MNRLTSKLVSMLLAMMLVLIAVNSSAQEVPVDAARFTWTTPTQRVDDSVLTLEEIQGYQLLWSTSPDVISAQQVNQLEVERINQYLFEGMAPATWYFAIRTMTTDGLMSVMSGIVSKTTQLPPPVEPRPPTQIEVE